MCYKLTKLVVFFLFCITALFFTLTAAVFLVVFTCYVILSSERKDFPVLCVRKGAEEKLCFLYYILTD